MHEHLRALHAAVPAPKLTHSEGLAVVATGEHITQFGSEAAARFFVEAHREVPALLEELAELAKVTDPAYVRELELRLATAQRDILDVERLLARSERTLKVETAAHTRAQQAGQAGLVAARALKGMSERLELMQRKLADLESPDRQDAARVAAWERMKLMSGRADTIAGALRQLLAEIESK